MQRSYSVQRFFHSRKNKRASVHVAERVLCKKTDLKSAGCFGAKDRRKITENDALSPHRAKTML